MCGICGYFSARHLDDELLIGMRDTIRYRGPDDAGIWQGHFGTSYIGMAHRRLSIIDLSELGHQPMISDDERYTIVFNGEIYNYREIREELMSAGCVFQSTCDTEVILYAYAQWKEKCFKKFNGMFAIAIWDRIEGNLILARDRMGVKPLYYYWNRLTGDFVFASELKPIMKYPGFHKDIRQEMLGQFLCNKYVASPDTIFSDTYKMIPGTWLLFDGKTIRRERYWDLTKEKRRGRKEQCTYIRENMRSLDEMLTDAVSRRLVADVPVGTFLSSGIDSALITAIAQKVSSAPVRTFTIGFYEKERNEADMAERIAKYLGTDHTQLYIGEKEILNLLEDMVRYYDEPFSDASLLPMMLVSKLASDQIKVALSGDGGDELFCGYKLYDLTYIAQKTDGIGSALRAFGLKNPRRDFLTPEIRAFLRNGDDDLKTQLFTDVMYEQAAALLPGIHIPYKFEQERRLKYRSWQERRMLLDMMTYLPDEVMCKTDRASMKYSLEVRSPLLDHRVVEASFSIPHDQKYHLFEKKHILRELAYTYVPKKLLSGPKKGFGVPLKRWLRTTLKPEVFRVTSKDYITRQGIFDPRAVQELINRQSRSDKVMYSSMLWSVYVFQRWWEEYIQ
ncbi:MAG: asparagine synthase (glutamine-hydrolyzing) [Lachnospiraceae bacterium]|nr:asparagine synthase (glutamine-hydrolyzing) [Lachnospiraceae bacterium]